MRQVLVDYPYKKGLQFPVRNGMFEWEKPLYELELRLPSCRVYYRRRHGPIPEIATLEKKPRFVAAGDLPESDRVAGLLVPSLLLLWIIELVFDDFIEFHGDRITGMILPS